MSLIRNYRFELFGAGEVRPGIVWPLGDPLVWRSYCNSVWLRAPFTSRPYQLKRDKGIGTASGRLRRRAGLDPEFGNARQPLLQKHTQFATREVCPGAGMRAIAKGGMGGPLATEING